MNTQLFSPATVQTNKPKDSRITESIRELQSLQATKTSLPLDEEKNIANDDIKSQTKNDHEQVYQGTSLNHSNETINEKMLQHPEELQELLLKNNTKRNGLDNEIQLLTQIYLFGFPKRITTLIIKQIERYIKERTYYSSGQIMAQIRAKNKGILFGFIMMAIFELKTCIIEELNSAQERYLYDLSEADVIKQSVKVVNEVDCAIFKHLKSISYEHKLLTYQMKYRNIFEKISDPDNFETRRNIINSTITPEKLGKMSGFQYYALYSNNKKQQLYKIFSNLQNESQLNILKKSSEKFDENENQAQIKLNPLNSQDVLSYENINNVYPLSPQEVICSTSASDTSYVNQEQPSPINLHSIVSSCGEIQQMKSLFNKNYQINLTSKICEDQILAPSSCNLNQNHAISLPLSIDSKSTENNFKQSRDKSNEQSLCNEKAKEQPDNEVQNANI